MTASGRRGPGLARPALVIGAAIVLIAAGVAAAAARATASPDAVTTTTRAVTTTVAATTTVAPTSTSAAATTSTASTAPLPSLPEPASTDVDPAATLVPRLVAEAERLTTAGDQRTLIDAAITDGTNTVAVEDEPATICAVVPVSAPVATSGRWQRDGEPLDDSAEERRDPPGFGECLTADEGETLDEGVYQYLAVGAAGARSAVATLVIGAAPVTAWLLNDGEQSVCLVLAAPGPADLYEAFAADSELLPGEALAIRFADVDHDVQVYGCPPDDPVRSFDLMPRAGVYVPLFGGEGAEGSTPSSEAATTSTTLRPTITASG